MQQPGLWAAHLTRVADVLAARYASTETLMRLYQKKSISIENNQEGRTAGRKQQKPSSRMLRAQVLHNLQVLVSKGGRHRAVYRFASRHASNTICQIIKWLLQHMLQIPFRLQP